MFAVKGWAVNSSALKPQTEPFKTGPLPQKPQRNQLTPAASGEPKAGKKRKRGDAPGPSGGEADVGKLWAKHIEGGAPDPPKKVKKAKVDGAEPNRPKTKKEKKAAKAAKKAAKKPVSANDTPLGERKERKEEVEEGGEEMKDDAPQEMAKFETGAERLERENKAPKTDEIVASKKDNKWRKSGEDRNAAAPPAVAKGTTTVAAIPPPAPTPAAPTLTPMQAAMRQKLISARFRHLNQTLYTEPSLKALQLFSRDPQMFEDYHSGFRQQVAVWPSNPVDTFIETIRSRGGIRLPHQKKPFKGKFAKGKKPAPAAEDSNDLKALALPRTQGVAIIADLGCGDARLAQTFQESGESHSLNLKVLSYDLHSPSPLVTKADISKIPTEDGSVDVAIFCLALMGTNWISFIEEAYRILHWKGELWIAEIKSRFGRVGGKGQVVEHSVGGKRKLAALKKAEAAKQREGEEVNEQDALAVEVDGVESVKTEETDVSAFVDVLRRRGFLLKNEAIVKNGESSIDLSNKMFVRMEFVKAATPTKGKCVPAEEDRPANAERFKKTKAKFLDEDVAEVATDDEAKVLKPCLYKIR